MKAKQFLKFRIKLHQYQVDHEEEALTPDSDFLTKLFSSEQFNGLDDDHLKSIAPRLSKAYLQHLIQAKDEWERSASLIEFLMEAHCGQLQLFNNSTFRPERTHHLKYSNTNSPQTKTYRLHDSCCLTQSIRFGRTMILHINRWPLLKDVELESVVSPDK
ncbi:hypothetical protein X801_06247 [Opisthorchis viverrini]|uniref:Uncharacterized protein n=1 Tax=Opisthorchis viverrini TaxID=6198 RepID=A0A1S8WTZ1_OPIVI|nr:hypothetical protein X801_06247 [Opisthorchis viverrini]